MSKSVRNLGVRVFPPERPPKPISLLNDEAEPLYMTTLPPSITQNNLLRPKRVLPSSISPNVSLTSNGALPASVSSNIPVKSKETLPASTISPNVAAKPKGILKNNSLKSNFKNSGNNHTSNGINDELIFESDEDVGHFDLKIEESEDVDINDQNIKNSFKTSNGVKSKSKLSSKKYKPTKDESRKSKKNVKIKDKKKVYKRENIHNLPADMYSKAVYAAKIESVSGIMHLLVIVCSIITLISMAILTNDWEVMLRRCPLYVKTSQSDGIYWGNEKLASCHYVAYMPSLTLIVSFSLIMFHGGILMSWRRGYEAYKILLSKTYAKILYLIELLEMVIAISIAGVLIDGVRQTCLGFQLSPWSVERPENCQEGYADRDEVYGISNTYAKLMTSMVASTVSATLLIITSIIYLIRINPCCKGNLKKSTTNK